MTTAGRARRRCEELTDALALVVAAPRLHACPRCGTTALTREPAPRCGRCGAREDE